MGLFRSLGGMVRLKVTGSDIPKTIRKLISVAKDTQSIVFLLWQPEQIKIPSLAVIVTISMCVCVHAHCAQSLSHVRLFATPWTVVR